MSTYKSIFMVSNRLTNVFGIIYILCVVTGFFYDNVVIEKITNISGFFMGLFLLAQVVVLINLVKDFFQFQDNVRNSEKDHKDVSY